MPIAEARAKMGPYADALALAAGLKAATGQLVEALERAPWRCDPDGPWWRSLRAEVARKKAELGPGLSADDVRMGY